MKELKHLNKYFKKYWFKLFIGVLTTVVARIFSLIMPSYVNESIQSVEAYLGGAIDFSQAKTMLVQYILIIIGAALLSALFTFLMRQTIINVSRYIEYDLKNEIFDLYQLLGLDFYKNNRIGDLMNRISEDVNQVRMYAGPAIMYGIQTRSEERRVGKECRSRWSADHVKQKQKPGWTRHASSSTKPYTALP